MVLNTNTVTKRQEEIFNSIQNIQTIERDLYNLLNDLSVVEPDSEMQKRIINQIESLSKIRINMLKDLTSMYNKLHVNITDSKVNLNDQQKQNKNRNSFSFSYNFNCLPKFTWRRC